MRALIVEDDKKYASILENMLKNHGICSDVCYSGYTALQLLTGDNKYYFVLLDYKLPDLEGIDFIRRARISKVNKNVPILVISSSESRDFKVQSLQIGADDYIIKGLTQEEEVVARIYNAVRRSNGFSTNILNLGAFTLDLDAKQVFVNGQLLDLTATEYSVLQLLMLKQGGAIQKDQLLYSIYSGLSNRVPGLKMVDVLICKIRTKIKKLIDVNPIQTRWGFGYQFDPNPSSNFEDAIDVTEEVRSSLAAASQIDQIEMASDVKKIIDDIRTANNGLPENILSVLLNESKFGTVYMTEALKQAISEAKKKLKKKASGM